MRNLLVSAFLSTAYAFALAGHPVDDVLDRAAAKRSVRNEATVGSSVFGDADKARSELQDKVDAGDQKIRDRQARRETWQAESKGTASEASVPKGGVTPRAAAAKAAPLQQKSFSCTIYCNNTSGPTIQRRFSADSRAEAARQAGDLANQMCQNSGYAKSSSKTLSEGQCRLD